MLFALQWPNVAAFEIETWSTTQRCSPALLAVIGLTIIQ
jgi:hypothetical protein